MSEAQGRRLSAILMADIVGYTKLVEQDTDGTVTAWKAARANVIDPAISEHAGHIVKHTGDGFLVEFSSVKNAVSCAMDMQRELDAFPLSFRIGISLGDVVDDGDDIHGEGVNIAARIEALAEPGGICISGSVFDAVQNRITAAFEDMGEHTVKHVTIPVRVFQINSETRETRDKTVEMTDKTPSPQNEKPSIAVLPFDNMSGDPEQEYFADGIAEDILTALSRFSREITVIDRHSSFSYKGKPVTAIQVGQELGASFMLEGSVRRSGNQVRITAQLIDCLTGGHLWAERYDRSMNDIFVVQDEITRHVTTALSIELVYGDYIGNWMRGTENFVAWDAMSKAAFEFLKFTREGFQACLESLERALAADPDYGMAMVSKGFYYMAMASYFSNDPKPLWVQARKWCDKALAITASKPQALALLSMCEMSEGRYEHAIEVIKEAISLAPTAENHYILGRAYLYQGKPEDCINQTEQVMRLSPLCPGYFLLNMIESHRILGQTDDALTWVDRCIEKMPESPLPQVRKAGLLSLAGRHEESVTLAKEVLVREPDFSVTAWAKGLPYQNPEHIEPFAETLRQVGLPD